MNCDYLNVLLSRINSYACLSPFFLLIGVSCVLYLQIQAKINFIVHFPILLNPNPFSPGPVSNIMNHILVYDEQGVLVLIFADRECWVHRAEAGGGSGVQSKVQRELPAVLVREPESGSRVGGRA